jgi:hypothetical protein
MLWRSPLLRPEARLGSAPGPGKTFASIVRFSLAVKKIDRGREGQANFLIEEFEFLNMK